MSSTSTKGRPAQAQTRKSDTPKSVARGGAPTTVARTGRPAGASAKNPKKHLQPNTPASGLLGRVWPDTLSSGAPPPDAKIPSREPITIRVQRY